MLAALVIAGLMVGIPPEEARAQGPGITVTYPNGGEKLIIASTVNITWRATGITGEVEIDYSTDGLEWRKIDRVSAESGSLAWKVPHRESKTVRVRISERKGSASDISDADFEIAPDPLDITIVKAPNGGEIWTEGETHPITWQAPLDATGMVLELSTDGGTTWSQIASVGATPSEYAWTVPHLSDQDITGALIKVSVAGAPDEFDQSDATFTIRAKSLPPTPTSGITVAWPNGGEQVAVDSVVQIRWSVKDVTGTLRIEFSENGGSTWDGVTTIDAAAGSYFWKVAGKPTRAALMRVTTMDGKIADTSDRSFEILARGIVPPVAGPIVLLSPNGGEVWSEGETHTIDWRTPADVSSVSLAVSIDNGGTWQSIATLPSTVSSIAWRVPHLLEATGTEAMIRVASTSDTTRYDMSDRAFRLNFKVTTAGVGGNRSAGTEAYAPLLYPNPARGMATVRWYPPASEEATLRLYRPDGTLARESSDGYRTAGVWQSDIDLHGLAAGAYMVEITAGDTRVRTRLVVAP
jgi:hypothetical protein